MNIKPLTVDLTTKWIAALRSGEYKQATNGCLRKDDCHCALGVLCAIVDNDNWLPASHYDLGDFFKYKGWVNKYLPETQTHIVGIVDKNENGQGLSVDFVNEIIYLNDNQGKSFEQIADWIEEHFGRK